MLESSNPCQYSAVRNEITHQDDLSKFDMMNFGTQYETGQNLRTGKSSNTKRCNKNRSTALKAKLDTGTQGNILSLRLYRQMYPQNLTLAGFLKPGTIEISTTVLTAYGRATITQHGTCKIPCEFKGRKSNAVFFVTEAEVPAIIGLPTCLELDLVTMNFSVQKSSTPETTKYSPNTDKPVKDKGDLTSQYQDSFD